MSSILVIQLDTKPVPEHEQISFCVLEDDNLYLSRCDYDMESRAIEEVDEWISDSFGEIATVDVAKRTLTFRDKDTVRNAWMERIRNAYDTLMESVPQGRYATPEYFFRTEVTRLGIDSLPFYFGYCHNPSELVADYLQGTIPDTLHIGAVLEGHC